MNTYYLVLARPVRSLSIDAYNILQHLFGGVSSHSICKTSSMLIIDIRFTLGQPGSSGNSNFCRAA